MHIKLMLGRTSLLKTVVFSVSLGIGFGVETTQLDDSGRLVSVGSAYLLEIFAEYEKVKGNRVVNSHNASKREDCYNGGIYE